MRNICIILLASSVFASMDVYNFGSTYLQSKCLQNAGIGPEFEFDSVSDIELIDLIKCVKDELNDQMRKRFRKRSLSRKVAKLRKRSLDELMKTTKRFEINKLLDEAMKNKYFDLF